MTLTLTNADGTVLDAWTIKAERKHREVAAAVEIALAEARYCDCDSCGEWYLESSMIERPGAQFVCPICSA
jgi:hypothetical protein